MDKILIVDDEKSIRDLISMTLSLENYTTVEASDGQTAFEMIQANEFDLILLDIMLPKITGIELLNKIKHKNIPVIFLTAKSSLNDKVFGLKLGAEDYITKPFEPLELLARIEVILRRNKTDISNSDDNNDILKFNNIIISKSKREVTLYDELIYLTSKEFDLLVEFIQNIDIVLNREVLLDKIWGYDYYGETRTVDMHVKQIRKKLNLKDNLQTVYKVGYKLKY